MPDVNDNALPTADIELVHAADHVKSSLPWMRGLRGARPETAAKKPWDTGYAKTKRDISPTRNTKYLNTSRVV